MWRIRDIRLLVPGRALAAGANAMLLVVLQLRVHDSGAGPWGTAMLLGAMSIPSLLGFGTAGRLVDRASSRRVLVTAYAVAALATMGVALAPSLSWLLAGVLVLESAWIVAGPTWSALVPAVVGEERVGEAIGLQMAVSATVTPLAGGLGGLLVGRYGSTVAVLVVAAVFVALVPLALAVRTVRTGILDAEDTLGGLALIRSDAVMWPLVCGLLVGVVFLGAGNVVEVYLVRDVLRGTPEQYGVGELALGAGSVIGGLLAGRLRGDRAWLRGDLVGVAGMAAGVLALGLAPTIGVFWLANAAVGLLNAMANTCLSALLTSRTASQQRGRVYAALNGLASGANILAVALGALGGTLLGPRSALVGAGAMTIVVTIVVAVRVLRMKP